MGSPIFLICTCTSRYFEFPSKCLFGLPNCQPNQSSNTPCAGVLVRRPWHGPQLLHHEVRLRHDGADLRRLGGRQDARHRQRGDAPRMGRLQIQVRITWLPDGYGQIFFYLVIFRSYVFGPSGFWTTAPLRCAA